MLLTKYRFAKAIEVFAAMCGWRLGHLTFSWVAGGVASFVVAQAVSAAADARLTALYFVATCAFYYVGNGLLLTSKRRFEAIAAMGPEAAYRKYEMQLGVMFVNQGLALGCLASLPGAGLPLSPEVRMVLGALLFAVGLGVKSWSTWLVGIDVYYYKDMFLNRRTDNFVASGPYRWVQNPMYGIGQAHAYGYAIVANSRAALVGAIVCNVAIYTFYELVEKPFVIETYGRRSLRPAAR